MTPNEERQPAVTPKPLIGRPPEYTLEQAEVICAQLAAGFSLRTVCRQEGAPSIQTVFNWMRVHPDFLERYTRATKERAEMHAEDIVDIADDSSADYVERLENGKASVLADHDHINRARLRVDARKWIASKLLPHKYGDTPAVVINQDVLMVSVPAVELPAAPARVIDVPSEPKS